MNIRATPVELLRHLLPSRKGRPSLVEMATPTPAIVKVDLRGDVRRSEHERGRPARWRDPDTVTGITIHQTAIELNVDHPRLPALPAHCLIDRMGRVALLNFVTDYMYHGDALNSFTIGMELESRVPGVEGDERTFWLRKSEKRAGMGMDSLALLPTAVQLSAARHMCRYYSNIIGWPTTIYAHRQGHKSRTSDPGQEIWSSVALELSGEPGGYFAVSPDATFGSGKPIPKEWR